MPNLLEISKRKRNKMCGVSEKLERLYYIKNNFEKDIRLNISVCGNGFSINSDLVSDEVLNTIKIIILSEIDRNIKVQEQQLKTLIGDYEEELNNG